jgi:hypothetical protein
MISLLIDFPRYKLREFYLKVELYECTTINENMLIVEICTVNCEGTKTRSVSSLYIVLLLNRPACSERMNELNCKNRFSYFHPFP